MDAPLVIPAFVAGLLTFLAPCTLPLVPGYLSFISGVSADDLRDPGARLTVRGRVLLNGLLYVLGFSAVFILMGTAFAWGGAALGSYRGWLSRIGGAFVILFGLSMLGAFSSRMPKLLGKEARLNPERFLKPGRPWSSFVFGSAFAFGWTPCIGPILGSVLLLASSTATVGRGALLLGVFSLGLATPFLLLAAGIGHAADRIRPLMRRMKTISAVGGAFLVFLGALLVADKLSVWTAAAYRTIEFIDYNSLLDYL